MADPDPELTEAVQQLAEENVEPARRRKLLGRLVRSQTRKHGVKDLFKPKAAVRWRFGSGASDGMTTTDFTPHSVAACATPCA